MFFFDFKNKKLSGQWFACVCARTTKMTVAELQAEVTRVNAAYVSLACEHRENTAAMQARVKALEADLATAKQTCRDQEFHMSQVSGAAGARGAAAASAENVALRKRCAESEEENEALRKRVRELEVLELGWTQLRGIFTTEREKTRA